VFSYFKSTIITKQTASDFMLDLFQYPQVKKQGTYAEFISVRSD